MMNSLLACRFFIMVFLIVNSVVIAIAHGHENSISVLSLTESQPGNFLVRWQYTPGPNSFNSRIIFPEHCSFEPPLLNCGDDGLVGKLSFMGLGQKQSATLIRLSYENGKTDTYTLTSSQPSVTIVKGGTGWLLAFRTYTTLGIEHILLGVDHLLFVFGLILIVRNPWMLVKTITAFTIAHTITLGAATLGWVGVPERPVNAAIALSIAFVALEILKMGKGEMSVTARHPWLVSFAFGLLHGFGFAGALTQLGLPQENIPLALLFFNVGVEVGQVGFVLLVLALQWAHRQMETRIPRWSEPVPSYLIGSLAMFWFISRFNTILQG